MRRVSLFDSHKPLPIANELKPFIAEFGRDDSKIIIFEDHGSLCALFDSSRRYCLTNETETTFRILRVGLDSFDGKLTFEREHNGDVSHLVIDGLKHPRRLIPGVNGPSFRIKPQRPVDVLMKEALAAQTPRFQGEFATPDLVDLSTLDSTLKFDIRYATSDNFLGTPVYPIAKASLQRPAAEALLRVHRSLEKDGLGLLIHDAYRPWYVTKVFWDATPLTNKIFVADPSVGSRHNRGCAVDLTLYDRATGQALEMPGVYDEFSDRSYPFYPGGTSLQRWNREKLRKAMESEGFTVYEAEWWHFDYRDWKKYPVLNVPLDAKKK